MAQATSCEERARSRRLLLPYKELGDQTPIRSLQQDILQTDAVSHKSGKTGIEPTLFAGGRHCNLKPWSLSNLGGLKPNERR